MGCKDTTPIERTFEPNYLFAYRMGYPDEVPTDQHLSDTNDLLKEWFGTPDNPQLPPLLAEDDYSELISLETMKAAVGKKVSDSTPEKRGCMSSIAFPVTVKRSRTRDGSRFAKSLSSRFPTRRLQIQNQRSQCETTQERHHPGYPPWFARLADEGIHRIQRRPGGSSGRLRHLPIAPWRVGTQADHDGRLGIGRGNGLRSRSQEAGTHL